MSTKKSFKKVVIGFAVGLAALVLIWLFLPFWLPLVFRVVAARYGIEFRQYEHAGFRRLTLHSASFTNKNVSVRANRLDLLAPSAWTFRLLTADSSEPFVIAEGWTVEVRTNAGPRRPSPGSMYTNVLQVKKVSEALENWIPLAVLSNGAVRTRGFSADISSALWSNGVLRARLTSSISEQARLSATIDAAEVTRFAVQSDSPDARLEGKLSTTGSGLDLNASGLWLSNQFKVEAAFGRTSLLPETTTLQMHEFRIPSTLLRATNYPDVFGSLNADWRQGEFSLDLVAGTTFLSPTSPPPVHVTLKARGDTNTAVIHSAVLNSPWLTVELSRDFVVHFSGRLLDQPGFVRVAADLSRQSWLPVTGLLQGDATLSPVGSKYPDVHFRLSGADTGTRDIKAKAMDVAGIFNWPLLNVTALAATFDDNSHAEATGIVNLETSTVTNGHVVFTGPLANRWLPADSGYDALTATAELSGHITNLAHRGFLDVTNFNVRGVRPLNAHVSWNGQGLTTFSAASRINARQSSVELEGKVETGSGRTEVLLDSLLLKTNERPLLQLGAPVPVKLLKEGTNTVVDVQSLHLSGAAGELDAKGTISWPLRGTLDADVRGMDSGIISDFIEAEVPEFSISQLKFAAGWSNGPVTGHASVLASGVLPVPTSQTNAQLKAKSDPQLYPLTLQLSLTAEPERISISNLLVTTRTSNVASASGVLPITLSPLRPKLVDIATNRPFQFSAMAKPDAIIWQELSERAKVRLTNATLRVEAAGTWNAPNARVNLTSDQVQFAEAGPKTPAMSGLSFTANVERTRAKAELNLLVQGLPVTAAGEMPLDKEFWAAVNKKELPSFDKASGRFRISDSDMALFTSLYPTLLAPQGDVVADIALLPGGRLQGDLTIANARTRPFPSVGPVREINLGISFLDRSAVPTATARVGGALVRVAGAVDLAGTNWLHGELPPFKLVISGTNVPLSRKPESIIRSDLGLTVRKTNGAPPVITGTARLRNSFYLSDVRALLPSGGGSAPRSRPPYFSIDDPFFADWRLGVHVTGDRFLKIRSTLFNGETSGNFRLQGTLKDPMALGDLRLASGSVRFPFGSLTVQQGFVTLGSQDPYRPHLALSATARQFGYDIRMDASGPADQPLLQFSSTPPLSSEQIVLMITAGQVPREQQVYSTSQRAQTFALFLGRDLLAQLGLADNAQERLTVRSGEQISETGRPTYNIEYKLTPTWSVTGEYDRFNDYNVGLKWRVYSK